MKVKLARTAGFCMGVRRALDMVLKAANNEEKPIYTYGPLIHNPQVLELLVRRGVVSVNRIEDIQGGTVFIRAHGVPPEEKRKIADRCNKVIDATCPHVVRAQVILDKYAAKGYRGIIVGEPDHPEVIGLWGFTHGRGVVVQHPEELHQVPSDEKVVIVAQTTQHSEDFDQLVRHAETYFKDMKVERTICGATRERQEEVRQLASQVEGMVVVGGYNSGNTRRLAMISRESGVDTRHVETDAEIDPETMAHLNLVGVTAGASTPSWMIKRVVQKLQNMRGRDSGWWGAAVRLPKFMLQSCLYVALAGSALTYAGMTAQGLVPSHRTLEFLLIAFLFLYSLHNLNHFLDREAEQFNDPERIRFFDRNKRWLASTGILAQILVLILTFRIGTAMFLISLLVMVVGLLYSVPLVPPAIRGKIPYSRIKDIPGSKSIAVALGWGFVAAFLPALAVGFEHLSAFLQTFMVILVLVYVRSSIFELLEVQGDMIVGNETLPILLGEKRTLNLLNAALVVLAVAIAGVTIAGYGGRRLWLFEICCVYGLICVWLYRKEKVEPGPAFELLVESNFILVGVAAYAFNHGLPW